MASATARHTAGMSGLTAATNRGRTSFVVRASSSELKRPELRRPEAPSAPAAEEPAVAKKLFTEIPVVPTVASPSSTSMISIEYQRQRAKEMTKYFQAVKMEQVVSESRVFGWTPANEINNGRWVMFGFSVGLLTEYATGVDFIKQFALMISYLGIADLD
eukprot:CAMPEP_0119106622 /NCGR_PEP_ID=MMETSP1180-20130426/5379_1 /TAXON_ID=3052 ORGANISM="Chlamydomonas cf sp, Strain CCMP681" /NCGR_SAMPLE_ID=MMETSP1180 /ASSEMBLY_ACC=CAM_ASM_000741 /LENGTH=159 /DNA_ID=CAMNT_0007091987 /DNA_START=49 /DNA_END=528 /DNA_ORIENTATION=+